METISVGRDTLVKASVLAKELGYTADYVGQLCRSGKIKAQLVGRSWYVDRDELTTHKRSRGRSNTTKTKQAVAEHLTVVSEQAETPVPVRTKHTNHFYKKIATPAISYAEDEHDLMPAPKKATEHPVAKPTGDIEVGLAGAETLSVRSVAPAMSIEATPLPKVRFKGQILVTEAVSEPVEDPAEESAVLVAKTSPKKSPKKRLRNTSGAISMKRSVPKQTVANIPAATTDGAVSIPITGEFISLRSVRIHALTTFSISVVAAVIVAISVYSLQFNVTSTETTSDTDYSFNLASLINSLK